MWHPTGPADAPLLVVVGNCQAESLRLLLDAGDLRTVRLPPVFELTAADVEPLARLLAATDLLVTQPISPDYRGLPVGSDQLAAHLPPGGRHVLVPTVRYAGLHPHHLLVHPPGLDDPDPPVVPYHDVRTTVAAAWARAGRPEPDQPPLTEAAVLEVAARSVAELARREAVSGAVPVSDLLAHPTADHMRTVNHPGNPVLEPLTARVRAALGLPARPPGVDRPLLMSIHAPLEPAVVAAHRLAVPPREEWLVEGVPLDPAVARAAHLEWYAARPAMLDAALVRAAGLVDVLGLALPPALAAA